jgi:hypothetical protein
VRTPIIKDLVISAVNPMTRGGDDAPVQEEAGGRSEASASRKSFFGFPARLKKESSERDKSLTHKPVAMPNHETEDDLVGVSRSDAGKYVTLFGGKH